MDQFLILILNFNSESSEVKTKGWPTGALNKKRTAQEVEVENSTCRKLSRFEYEEADHKRRTQGGKVHGKSGQGREIQGEMAQNIEVQESEVQVRGVQGKETQREENSNGRPKGSSQERAGRDGRSRRGA